MTPKKLHLDGARAWNASISLGIEMHEYVRDFDLVTVCMSKGMGAPVGSLLVGSFSDIEKAKEHSQMLGGVFDSSNEMAACALVSLDGWEEHLARDNENATFMANELALIPGI